MPIPRKIRVGPLSYKVERAELDGEYGHCDHNDYVIRLRRGLPAEASREVLFHEVLHAACELLGFGWSEDEEEQVVRRLSPALLDVLQRNEALRHYLFGHH